MPPLIVQVAVPSPLRRGFDYLVPETMAASPPRRGARVRVPFGRGYRVGVVLRELARSDLDPQRLRPLDELLDPQHPTIPGGLLDLLEWAADYYHHPIGEVVFAALPAALRQPRRGPVGEVRYWRLTEAGRAARPRGPKQAALLALLGTYPDGLAEEQLGALAHGWRSVARAPRDKGWLAVSAGPCLLGRESVAITPEGSIELSGAQRDAVAAVLEAGAGYQPFLLEGVTGSGKTEVYLRVIERELELGRQALVLIPEIGLTPQTAARFRDRFGASVAVLHSGLSDRERACTWQGAGRGAVRVVVGTRSAVFVPLRAPGIIIVDEEHDLSYKQQDGFRYSARDLAVVRARREGATVILGTATPSLESLHNALAGRYRHLILPQRATGHLHPRLKVVDLRNRPLRHGLSDVLLQAVAAKLGRGEQILLFLNRRGYAPTVLCHACGWVADCRRCDAHMTLHAASQRLRCHHCGAERPMPRRCPDCGGDDLRRLGKGTERLEESLHTAFPLARVARIDRDSTRRKGALDEALNRIHAGEVDILIGTQMVAKGHHFPNVTLVGIIDADGGLFSADFRASERMAQLVVQVAGRAGRGRHPGQVLIQTHHPEHPLLTALVEEGYDRFALRALEERREAGLAPFASMGLLRAEAAAPGTAMDFLAAAAAAAGDLKDSDLLVLGPVPAPMERRAGRFRAQLLVQSPRRPQLQTFLRHWLPLVEKCPGARRVRWSLDVDAQEMV